MFRAIGPFSQTLLPCPEKLLITRAMPTVADRFPPNTCQPRPEFAEPLASDGETAAPRDMEAPLNEGHWPFATPRGAEKEFAVRWFPLAGLEYERLPLPPDRA